MRISNRKGHTVIKSLRLRSPLQIIYASGNQHMSSLVGPLRSDTVSMCPQYEDDESCFGAHQAEQVSQTSYTACVLFLIRSGRVKEHAYRYPATTVHEIANRS